MMAQQTLKILIVEDDLLIGENLAERLIGMGYLITDVCVDAQAALQSFRRRFPDLVIMDIRLGEGKMDGIRLSSELKQIHGVPIIYLTAFGDPMTVERALRTNPANYLLKPCTAQQLSAAIDLALRQFMDTESKADPSVDSSLLYKEGEFFFAKKTLRYVKINIPEILWVKAMGSSVEIHAGLERLVFSTNLTGFIQQIDHPDLIRIHRSYVVNIRRIAAFDESQVYIGSGKQQIELPISGQYKDEFLLRVRRLRAS